MSEALPRFFAPIRVRYYETDLQGHVNFIWHQSYFAIAAADYLKAVGWSYDQLGDKGYDLLFIDAHGTYLGPCFYDEVLHIYCKVERIGNSSIRFAFNTIAKEGARQVATGDMTAVLVDKADRQKTSVPESFRKAVTDFESNDS
jgi:acyl-CoA thioester hydrolase